MRRIKAQIGFIYSTTNFLMPERRRPMPMPWTVTLDIRSVRERKAEAFRQHVSQAPLMEKTKEMFERFGGGGVLCAGCTRRDPQAARLTTDLFEGLKVCAGFVDMTGYHG